MNKKLICLILALMMLCMGAVGLAADTHDCATDGHVWDPYTFFPWYSDAQQSQCTVCSAYCGYTHTPENLKDGPCKGCGRICGMTVGSDYLLTHRYTDGACVTCGDVCEHPTWSQSFGVYSCDTCYMECNGPHEKAGEGTLDANGKCTVCPYECSHYFDYENPDTCTDCGFVCTQHNWVTDEYDCTVCSICDTQCYHDEYGENGCTQCGKTCDHWFYESAVCQNYCGYVCPHETRDPDSRICSVCECTIAFVTFNPNNNGIDQSIVQKYVEKSNASYQLPQCTFTAPENGTFAGWLVDGEVKQPGSSFYLDGDLIIDAQWDIEEVETYHAFYVYDINGDTPPHVVGHTGSHTILSPEACGFTAPDGKEFDCWLLYVNGVYKDYWWPNNTVNETLDFVFVANWVDMEAVEYTVTYNMGDGKIKSFDKNNNEVWVSSLSWDLVDGSYEMLPPAAAVTAPSDSQKLAYWVCNGKAYEPSAMVQVSGDMTFTPVWTAPDKFTVIFDGNGATGGSMDPQSFTDGVEQALTQNGFVCEDAEFAGWCTSPLGMGESFEDKETIVVEGNMTLYAMWMYSVTLDPANGVDDAQPAQIPMGTQLTMQNPDYYGFSDKAYSEFVHWVDSKGNTYEPGYSYIVTGKDTLTAVWETLQVTVSFDGNGATTGEMNDVTVDAGEYKLPSPAFGKDFHNFAGWLVNGEGEVQKENTTITLTSDTTLTAQWTAMTEQVTFRKSSSSTTDEEVKAEMTYGQTYEMPDPSELNFTADTGYKFAGWKNSNGGAVYQAGESFTLEDWALFIGQWDKLEYTVEFAPGVGGEGTMSSQTIKYNEACSLPENGFTAKEGYEFTGWLVDGVEHPVDTDIFVTGNMTVTASWKLKTYTVTYDHSDIVYGEIEPATVEHGAQYTLVDPRNVEFTEGKDFKGWLIDGKEYGTIQPITVTSDLFVTPKLETRKVTLTYVDTENNPIGSHAYTKDYGSEFKVLSLSELGLTAPDGMKFGSWLVLNTAGGIIGEVAENGSLEVYSNWMIRPNWVATDAVTYTLTFDMQGGNPIEATTALEGSYFETPKWEEIIHPVGYEFDYFLVGDKQYGATDFIPATGNLTAVAVWKDAIPYTVTFEANGGTGEMDSVTVLEGNTYELPECEFDPPKGHGFAGWKVNGGAQYDVGAEFTVEGNMTLTAQWNPQTFEISFDSNGGTGTQYPAYVTYGNIYPLPACTFTAPEGYHFGGWRSGDTVYEVGYGYSPEGDRVFDAEWVKNTYTITFESADDPGAMQSVTKEHGDTYELPACGFRQPIYNEFKAWDVNGVEKNVGDTITVTGNVTVKPIWNWIEFTVSFDAQGGTGTMVDVDWLAGTEYTVPACTFGAPEGMLFDAWYVDAGDDADLYKQSYQPGEVFTLFGNVKLKANWVRSDFKITYKTNYPPTANMEPKEHEVGINRGETHKLLSNMFMAPEGMLFKNWLFTVPPENVEIEEHEPGAEFTNVSDDLTFLASWEFMKYAVSFNGNGGAGSMDTVVLEHGSEFVLPECGFTAPTGMKFDSWTVTGECEPKDGSIIVKGTVELKANWVPVDINITYEPGDYGWFTDASSVVRPEKYGVEFKLPYLSEIGCNYSADDSVFLGWNVNGTYYGEGAAYTAHSDTTITAMWADRWYSFSYIDSYDNAKKGSVTIEYGTYLKLGNPSEFGMKPKKHHKFAYWSVGGKAYQPNDEIYYTSNKTIKAMWDIDGETKVVETPVEIKTEMTQEEVSEVVTAVFGKEEVEKLIEALPPEITEPAQIVTVIEEAVPEGYDTETMTLQNVELMFKPEGSDEWIPATEENFPTTGIRHTLSFNEGTSPATHEYKIIHMLVTEANRGDIEILNPEEISEDGVTGRFFSLSPISVVAKEKPVEDTYVGDAIVTLPETGDPSSLMGWITLLGASGIGLRAIKRRKK